MFTVGRPERFPVIAWLERRPRWQIRLVIALIAIYVLWQFVKLAAGIALDRWWYDTLTDAPVWSTITWAKVQLAAGGGLVTAIVLGATVWAVLRSAPVSGEIESKIVTRYHRRVGPAHRWVLIALVVVITQRVMVAAMDRWRPWVLFRHAPELDVSVPELGTNLADHLFRLPFLAILSAWMRSLVLAAFVIAVAGYALSGALRLPLKGRRSSTGALVHLALLAAAFFAVTAFDAVFVERLSLATSASGSFVGAGFTEVNVLTPALWFLAALALVTAFALINGARTQRWRLPLTLMGSWAVLQIGLLAVAPPLVDRYLVQPAEGDRQLPYVEHNLDATRTAYRLGEVEIDDRELADGLTASSDEFDQLADEAGVSLFTRGQLVSPLQVLQGTTATRITDVDIDRYEVEGERRPLFLAARNSSRPDLPERGWVQDHLVYTHGDAVVALPADTAAPDGRPDVNVLDGVLAPARPQLYFGEGLDGWYAIVGTKRPEFDGTSFEADTGVQIGSWFRRATLSIATGEYEPLLSSELTSDSQLLYRRDVRERVGALASFLSFDSDPYPVVTDDGVVWVVAGYTTSSTYPYSQTAPTGALPGESGVSGRPNYVRASVTATVDAYDGSVHLYRTTSGEDDVILQAWEEIFPGLVEPIADMPAELQQHRRYPSDMMTLQTQLLGRYHVTDAEQLFSGTDEWSVAGASSSGVGAQSTGAAPPVWLFQPGSGDDADDWVSVTPYNPGDASSPSSIRNELSALAIADHDRPDVLALVSAGGEGAEQLPTPLVAQSAIDADPELARLFALLNANGSQVQFGPMTPLLVDDELVYIRPIVVTGTADTTAPRLYGVVAVSDGFVGQGDTVAEALQAAAPESN